MNTNLHGKVALITGGSRGIGKAVAVALAAEGARIAICGRDERQLDLVAQELQSATHTDVLAMKANLTRLNDIRRFVGAAAKKFNRIDILVNNAGGAHIGSLLSTSDEEWDAHLQLKLMGYIRMAREAIPIMTRSGGGRIVNIIGMEGREPRPHFLIPAVIDGALLTFTRALAKELQNDNITVNSINPGTTDTPLTEQTFAALATGLHTTPEEVRKSTEASFPPGRLAAAEDVARAVLFLVSDAASFINGASLNIDAGKSNGVW